MSATQPYQPAREEVDAVLSSASPPALPVGGAGRAGEEQ